ncbi:MAG: ADOP family duplicated permease [Acidobacteria bacterium]|nr:ADOP family duplicated permease [Acidobacteriota bacterium]
MLKRLRKLFDRSQLDQDLNDELESHLALKQLYFERQGLAPAEAARQARLSLGNTTNWQESTRRNWTFPTLEAIFQDITFGLRILRKDKAFTSVIVITLLLGIGANTAVFQLLDSLLWNPLPVEKPDQLVRIRATNLPPGERAWLNGKAVKPVERLQIPYPLYEELAKRQDLFSGIAGISGQGAFAVEIDNNPHRLQSSVVTGSYFPVLGIQPAAGRFLSPADDIQGGPPEGWGVVISHRIWTSIFNRRPEAIGARITIERLPFHILGVTPEDFEGIHPGSRREIWLPVSSFETMFPEWNWRTNPAQWTIQPFARLRPGVNLEQVRNTLHQLSPSLLDHVRDPKLSGDSLKHHRAIQLDPVSARSGFSPIVNSYSPVLWLLLGAAASVLLLAVLNLTNLLLARATARQSEIAIRLALGASATRVRVQLLVETLLLATAGGGLGLIFAQWATHALLASMARDNTTITLNTDLNWNVLAFLALLITTVMGLAGWLPANSAIAQASQQRTAPRTHTRLRSGLVVIQFALSLALLGGASLMLLSLRSLLETPTGLNRNQTLYFSPDFINAQIPKERIPQIQANLLDQLRQQSGIQAAAWTVNIPLAGSLQMSSIEMPSHPNLSGNESMTTVHHITDGYFAAMGIQLIAGRDFPPRGKQAQKQAIVTENFARRFFKTPVGALNQRLRFDRGDWLVITGVSADTKYTHVRDAAPPTIYTNYWDSQTARGMSLIVHHTGPAAPVRELVNASILSEAGRKPFLKVSSPEEILHSLLATDRTLAILLAAFAVFALSISATGIAGLLGYTVQLRRKEIGIRLALGATAKNIQIQILRFAISLAIPGIALGAILSYSLRQGMTAYLFEVEPGNPVIWIAAASILLVAALIAAAIPAYRAATLDPQQVLRAD